MNPKISTQRRKGAEAEKVIVQRCSRSGADSQMFRAYVNRSGILKPLGVSAATTGNFTFAIVRCAAKAFIKLVEPGADMDEIETRVAIRNVGTGVWWAFLQPKLS